MPRRFLLLRHPQGISEERFRQFSAHCSLWRPHVEAVLANWNHLPLVSYGAHPPPRYEFQPPEDWRDKPMVALPIDGDYTVGSRSLFEDGSSYLLSLYFEVAFKLHHEEGLKEPDFVDTTQFRGNWRKVLRPAVLP